MSVQERSNSLLHSITQLRAQKFLHDTELGGEFDTKSLVVNEDGSGFVATVSTGFQMNGQKFSEGKIVEFNSRAMILELDF